MSKNKTTHIVCILDRSGSMGSLTDEVIGSFNNFIKEQKEIKGKAKVTTILFDDKYEVLHDKVNLDDVPELTTKEYFTRGMTAMNDAIGKTITSLMDKKKAIVLIQTDGAENASIEYTYDMVKQLVKKKTKDGWQFNFLGANIDAQVVGQQYGVNIANTRGFTANSAGVQDAFASMSVASTTYRTDKVKTTTTTTKKA